MPTPIVIEKQLSPANITDRNNEYSFRINLQIGGESVFSRVFTFKTPSATWLMSRLGKNFTFNILRSAGEKVPSTKTWNSDRFKKVRISGSECIQLRLSRNDDGFKELTVGTKIKFKTQSSGFLSGLHNLTAAVVRREFNNESRFLVTVKIPKNLWDNINRAIDVGQDLSVPANNAISLTTNTIIKKNQVSVKTDASIVDGLVKVGNVHDILVFAFKQYDGSLNSKVKRYYLKDVPEKNNNFIVRDEPLDYSQAKQLFFNNNKQKSNFSTVRFDPKEGKKFIIYATVVRYIRTGQEWSPLQRDGELPNGWLQLNTENTAIWGRAIAEGD
jgi:hypothetical protein